MSVDAGTLSQIKDLLVTGAGERKQIAGRVAEILRAAGRHRWVGIYDVDLEHDMVTNIAWSGPAAPAHPTFPVTRGLTSRAIVTKRTVNVGDVNSDPDYLTALGNTRSEIIVPILCGNGNSVVGTIDVESEELNAFDGATQSLLEECARTLQAFFLTNGG